MTHAFIYYIFWWSRPPPRLDILSLRLRGYSLLSRATFKFAKGSFKLGKATLESAEPWLGRVTGEKERWIMKFETDRSAQPLTHAIRSLLLAGTLFTCSLAESKPGDVFRKFTFDYNATPGTHRSELLPGQRPHVSAERAGNRAAEVFPSQDWQTARPETAGFDPMKLAAALDRLDGNIVVVRRGLLVGAKGNVTESIPIFSVSKSFTSIVFAVLLEQKRVDYEDTVPLSDAFGPPLAKYRDFLSMTSDFMLIPYDPGRHYAYNNAAVHHYGKQMGKLFFNDKTPGEIFQACIWTVIGRQDEFSYQGLWGGWGGGFNVSARDLARVGLLVLRNGNWNGKQVIPATFVEKLYDNQIPVEATLTNFAGPETVLNQMRSSEHLKGNYSFGWWTNASNLHPTVPRRTIYAIGLKENNIIVCPEYDLVVTKTSTNLRRPQLAPAKVLAPIIAALSENSSKP